MLIGKAIALRPIAPEDAGMLAEWFSDPNSVGPYNNCWPATRAEFERTAARPTRDHEEGFFLVVDTDMQRPIGASGYWNPYPVSDFFRGVELWWQIQPQCRRHGFGTQAASLLVNHLFNTLPLERIQASVAVGNDISCRVAENAGMQREGLVRRVAFLNGRYTDMFLYSIIREDWQDEATYRMKHKPF